jgi:hypothetical protein
MADVDLSVVPEVPARIVFMGGKATEGRARVLGRSDSWRRWRVARDLGLVVLSPVAFVVPPHIIWPPIVATVGLVLAYIHANERRTLLSLRGPCPKCGTEQEFRELGRMTNPHKVTCAHCRWDVFVEVPRAGAAT